MSTQRKRNRFLNARRDGNAYTMKLREEWGFTAAHRRGAKAVEARCENCETALR